MSSDSSAELVDGLLDTESEAEVLAASTARIPTRKRRKQAATSNAIGPIAVVIDQSLPIPRPLEHYVTTHHMDLDWPFERAQEDVCIAGLMDVSWEFKHLHEDDSVSQMLRDCVGQRTRAGVFGYCSFTAGDFVSDAHELQGFDVLQPRYRNLTNIVNMCANLPLYSQWIIDHSHIVDYIHVHPILALLLFRRLITVFASVPLSAKIRKDLWPMSKFLNRADINAFRPPPTGNVVAAQMDAIPPLRLSRCLSRRTDYEDPISILRFVEATASLRSGALLPKASQAIVRALFPVQAKTLLRKLEESGFEYPSRQVLDRARPRIAVVAMLFARSEWCHGRFSRSAGIRSIFIYCDSSPKWGRDIFAVIVDVYIDGAFVCQVKLPATTLGHGFTSTIDKTVALLWAIWLITGTMVAFEEFLFDVRCLSTDFGLEASLALVPNVLPVFAKRVLGLEVSQYFRSLSRLYPRSIQSPDWNHIISGVLKGAYSKLERWPSFLDMIRTLCKVLRNHEYRAIMRADLESKGLYERAQCLLHFSASFAKWRYQTLFHVFTELHRVSLYCETDFDVSILGKCEDNELRDKFAVATKHKALWRFIRVHVTLLRIAHFFRQWARGCSCHEQQLLQGKKIVCHMKTRRLQYAKERVATFRRDLVEFREATTLSVCEDDSVLLFDTKHIIQVMLSWLVQKFAFLHEAPYLFVNITDPTVAQAFLVSARRDEERGQHPVTAMLMHKYEALIERLAAGDANAATPELLFERDQWRLIPLTSDVAEGYHGLVQNEGILKRNASTIFILSSVNLEQDLAFLQSKLSCRATEDRFRYEYWNFTRILQTKAARECTRLGRRTNADCFEQIFRLGKYSRISFADVSADPTFQYADYVGKYRDTRGVYGKLAHEFYANLVDTQTVYSVRRPLADGAVQPPLVFSVVRKARGTEQLVFTSIGAKKEQQGLQYHVQPYAIALGDINAGAASIFPDGEPEWRDPANMTSNTDLVESMLKWRTESSNIDGCIDIRAPTWLRTLLPLENDKCPTLILQRSLLRLGWTWHERNMSHDPSTERRASVKDVTSKRYYFKCLLRLGDLFAGGLTNMPSNQPQSYYKLLLTGNCRIHPGLGDDVYARALKNDAQALEDVVAGVVPALEAGPMALAIEDDAESEAEMVPIAPLLAEPVRESAPPPQPQSPPAPLAPELPLSDDEQSEAECLDDIANPIIPLPSHINGAKITLDPYRGLYTRYIMYCRHHVGCKKRRNCHREQCKHFGQWEPVAFLACWEAMGADPAFGAEVHVDAEPSLEQVRQWLVDNGHV